MQRLPRDQRATVVDFFREVQVDLEGLDYGVLDMVKNNPKVDVTNEHGVLYFKYRAKFEIRNKFELLNAIDKVKSGISWGDIEDCYVGIQNDMMEMVMSGEIIAAKNKETRVQILYPRGRPFLTNLSATCVATPGEQSISTSEDIRKEVRRGDAIQVCDSWYRVASNLKGKTNQPERARAPLSVSSVEDLSTTNEYLDVFSDRQLPLDGDFDGDVIWQGRPKKHGCTNDLRERWKETLEHLKPFSDDISLEKELLRLNLIAKHGLSSSVKKFHTTELKRPKKRARRAPSRITNVHLKGTAIGDLISSTPDP